MSVAAGDASVQPAHGVCATNRNDANQAGQARRRKRQDLPALPARMETREYIGFNP